MKIRKANSSDLDQVFLLARGLATSFTPDKEVFEHSFLQVVNSNAGAILLVIEINNNVVAYCLAFKHLTFYANGCVTWVEELFVQENLQGKGIGKKLMQGVEQWGREQGSKLICLATRRSNAELFYKNLGYEVSATYLKKVL